MTADVFHFPKAADFEQVEAKVQADQIRVLRHVRAHQRGESFGGGVYEFDDLAPHGGVTFLFEIDYPSNTLEFSAAACHPDENFVYKKANDKVTKMFENGCTFTGDYNRELSLVDNAYNILADVYADGLPVRGYNDFTIGAIGGQLDYVLKRGPHDPYYLNLTFQVCIPAHLRHDFDVRVQAIIDAYNTIESQKGEKAA